jgi:hypothetical protein
MIKQRGIVKAFSLSLSLVVRAAPTFSFFVFLSILFFFFAALSVSLSPYIGDGEICPRGKKCGSSGVVRRGGGERKNEENE